MAESFVDSFKTELIKDRVWQTRGQLELAILEYVAWFNNDRLHQSLGDIPPVEFEQLHAATDAFPGEGSVTWLSPSGSERLTTRRFATRTPKPITHQPHQPPQGPDTTGHLTKRSPYQDRAQPSGRRELPAGLCDPLGSDHHQPMETN
jgi:putative transposase